MGADRTSPVGGFGELLRRHRRAAGLSQEELGERSGLTARAIGDMERGRTARPYRRSVRSLADALELGEPERALLDRASRPVVSPDSAASLPSTRPQPRRDGAGPRQLPAAVVGFTGRSAELAALTRLLGPGSAGRGPGSAGRVPALAVSAIAGTAGVGKTALAVQWAHQAAQQFPDGQLYVNLRGYDPDMPVAAADALAGFLRALGVPGQQIPDELDERARLYRSRLAGRRILVLLDNARDAEQVRPLLPGDPACVAVVTSRDALAGLVATDGARRLDLDVLPAADACVLLRSLIGPRADSDPEAVADLAGLCARLPLALRIAAEHAVARPKASLRNLVTELAAARLDVLDAGEDRADVRAVFSWSVRQLPEDVARTFSLVGLHPGGDLDADAVAALAGTDSVHARRVLGRLHRASLLHSTRPGRYAMHDLLRAYAREQAANRDEDGLSLQALTRLFDYYLAAAAAAMDVLFPAGAQRRPRIAVTEAAAAALPQMPGEAEARAWLDAERANLVAVVVHCAEHGWPGHATGLAGTLFRYLTYGSHVPEALVVYGCALQAARCSGDPVAEAEALNGLGGIGIMKGQFREATSYYHAALEQYRRCGDRVGQARVLHNLGFIEHEMHNNESAGRYYREAMAAEEAAGDHFGVAVTLCRLAGVEADLGSYDQAAEHLRLALPVIRDAKDQVREAEALGWMGELSLRRGRLTQAAGFFEESLRIFRRVGHQGGVADDLCNLAEVRLRRGDYRQAIDYLRQSLALHRRTGDQSGQIRTLRLLAEALHKAGQFAAARVELAAALRLASESGNTYQQACAHRDLAESHQSAGEDDQARHHWQQALDLYIELGAPEADQVRHRLRTHVTMHDEPRAGPGR